MFSYMSKYMEYLKSNDSAERYEVLIQSPGFYISRDQWFSTYAKFPEKLTFLTP